VSSSYRWGFTLLQGKADVQEHLNRLRAPGGRHICLPLEEFRVIHLAMAPCTWSPPTVDPCLMAVTVAEDGRSAVVQGASSSGQPAAWTVQFQG